MTGEQNETMRAGIGLIALALLLFAGPASAADDVRSSIEAANQKLGAAVASADGAAAAGLYTSDAQLLPVHSDAVSGAKAIEVFWQAAFDSGMGGASLTTLEVESLGDTAYEVGTFEFKGADGKVTDHGKYVVIWKREGGTWKLHRDIWTTSVAASD